MDVGRNPEQGLPRILVIDDEPGICIAVTLLLQDQFSVVTAMTADEGLAKTNDSFALILLDLRMPGVDAFALLDAIRRQAEQTPILLLSAMGDSRTRDDALRHGAEALIEKPFSRQELLLRINKILSISCGKNDC